MQIRSGYEHVPNREGARMMRGRIKIPNCLRGISRPLSQHALRQFQLLLSVFLIACNRQVPIASPSVSVLNVPTAGEGGPNHLEEISGTATGVSSGQRVVVYAHAGAWWVQPRSNAPFTPIKSSVWRTTTHIGTEYAALVVNPGFMPPRIMDKLPPTGDGIVAISVVAGRESLLTPAKWLHFSGLDWKVRERPGDRGGATRLFDPKNAFVDAAGHLHLRITRSPQAESCSEVALGKSFGYGSYLFTTKNVAELALTSVLRFSTWDPKGEDPNHREMDIELGRWGDRGDKNLRYVVQPFYVPANAVRFDVPPGVLTHELRWQPDEAIFKTSEGARRLQSKGKVLATHTFLSGIPVPGQESILLNFCVMPGSSAVSAANDEVVIETFQYLP